MESISSLCAVLCFLCIVATPVTLLTWLVLLIKKSEKKNKAKRNFLISLSGIVLFAIIGVATFKECEHDWDVTEKIDATCTESGTATKICTLCDSEETESIPAFGHLFAEEIIQAATCSATGLATKSCSVCNVTEEIVLDMIEHTYEYTTTKKPTLEESGVETGTCTVCGNIQEKEMAQLGTKANPGEVTVAELVAEINANKDAAKSKYDEKWIKITGKVLDAHTVAGMTSFYLHGEKGGSGLRIVCWVNEEVLKPFDYRGKTYTFIGQVREITTVNATEIGDCSIVTD